MKLNIRSLDGPRLIRPRELRASWRLSTLCFGGEGPPDTKDEGTEKKITVETYIFAAKGVPVAQISLFFTNLRIYDSVVKIGSIGGVCTHPDYRGHGLASRLLHTCTQRLADGGARLMVISGGRGMYRRAGCEPMGRFANFSIQPGPEIPGLALRPLSSEDAQMYSRIYQAEPVHFVRPMSVYLERIRPYDPGSLPQGWLVEMGGQPSAYMVLDPVWKDDLQPLSAVRALGEYAGSRVAISHAVGVAAAQLGINELCVPVAWQDADLIHLLNESGCSFQWTGLPGHTIRVINFPDLMSDLRLYLRARLHPHMLRGLRFEQAGPLLAGGEADRFSIIRRRERLNLDGAAMTRLVLGDPGQTDQLVPAPEPVSDVIQALFPLPSFFTGLDYH